MIADQAYVQGTVRSFKPEVQNYIEQRFKEIAKGLEQLFNVDIEVIYTKLPGTVFNDAYLTEQAKEAAQKVGYQIIELENPYTIGKISLAYWLTIQGYLHLLVLIVNTIYIIQSLIQMSVYLRRSLSTL